MDRLVHRSDDQEPVAQVEVSTGCFCGVVGMIPIPLFGGSPFFWTWSSVVNMRIVATVALGSGE